MYKHFFKRVIDFTLSLLALLVIWPILLVVYIWLTIANKGAGAKERKHMEMSLGSPQCRFYNLGATIKF